MTTPTSTSTRYERWSGTANRGRWTWLAIVANGLRQANKDSQARFLAWFALGFVFGNCGLFYAFAKLELVVGTTEAQGYYNMARSILGVDLTSVTRIGEMREVLWRTVFMFMINVELFWVVTTVSRIGPGLIADDIKNRSLPIYFARPVTPATYLAGKWMVVAVYVGLITLVPNVLSLILGVVITGGLQTKVQTMGLAVDLVLAGFGIMVFSGMLLLAISSATADKRYVTVGWYAVCLIPVVAQAIVNDVLTQDQTSRWLGCLSLRSCILILTERLFDMRGAFAASPLPQDAFQKALLSPVEPVYAAIVLGAVALVCTVFCYRRVVRFSRSAASI